MLALLVQPAGADARCDGNRAAVTAGRFVHALVCLHNAERRAHGLRRLRASSLLRKAARRHAGDMARGHYFDHVSRRGRTVLDRVVRTGYARRARVAVGENIFYGLPPLPTPAQLFAAWMASPGHRHQLLDGRWRELGVGAVMRPPLRGSRRGVTVVAVFGARRGR